MSQSAGFLSDSKRRWPVLLAGVMLLVGALFFAQRLFFSSPVANAGEIQTVKVSELGGDFTLKQAGQPVSLSDFMGKVVVIYFGFASCPDVCPTTLLFSYQKHEMK